MPMSQSQPTDVLPMFFYTFFGHLNNLNNLILLQPQVKEKCSILWNFINYLKQFVTYRIVDSKSLNSQEIA